MVVDDLVACELEYIFCKSKEGHAEQTLTRGFFSRIILFRIQWTMIIIKFLGVLELLATQVLVSSFLVPKQSPRRVLTIEQEYFGTTFWTDLPKWVQIPGSCPNLRYDEKSLQYTDTVVAPSSNNNAAVQAQQAQQPSNLPKTQNNLIQNPNNTQGASPPPSGFEQHPSVIDQGLQSIVIQQQPTLLQRHVFMITKVGRHHLLSQWDTFKPYPQNDREFFKKLRECYISTRGFWRHHFGFKVFSHCEFYRVSCLTF